MRDDHLHVGEVSSDIVQIDRFGVLEPQSASGGHSGSNAGMAGMEYRRQTVLGYHLVERIGEAVICKEPL